MSSGWVIIVVISATNLPVPGITDKGEPALAIPMPTPDLKIRGPTFATEDECLQYNREVIVPMDIVSSPGRTVRGHCEKEE
jgi:hypothetical protein